MASSDPVSQGSGSSSSVIGGLTDLTLQTTSVTVPITLTGSSGSFAVALHTTPNVRYYVDNFRQVDFVGPFVISLDTSVDANVVYGCICTSIVDRHADSPTTWAGVKSVGGYVTLHPTTLQPAPEAALTLHPEHALQVKPQVFKEQLPRIVGFWHSSGTTSASEATLGVSFKITARGLAQRKTW